MNQYLLTPAAGKRLIARALLEYEPMKEAVGNSTVVIVAGTTNGYVAEAWLKKLKQAEGFRREHFYRGLAYPGIRSYRLPVNKSFAGDVVIVKGRWQMGKTLFDVVDQLREGDVILKGANSLDLQRQRAGIFIAHPMGGTTLTLLQAVVGRRVRLILPVGLEKRVAGNLDEMAARINTPGKNGLRLMPVSGEIITEIEALQILFGVEAIPMAAGGVQGAEGAVWLHLEGPEDKVEEAAAFLETIEKEPPFSGNTE